MRKKVIFLSNIDDLKLPSATQCPLQLDLGLLAFVCQQRSLQELGHLYGVEADVNAMQEHQNTIGLESVSEKCFSGANIEIVLMDYA